jgi:hypothetical protein
LYAAFTLQAGIELLHGLQHPQPGAYRSLGVVFMGPRVAEVDEQAITQILPNVPLKAGDHCGAGLLIGPHHLAPLLGVELAGEHGRVHQVTKQYRELAAFGFSGTCFYRSRRQVIWSVSLAARRS